MESKNAKLDILENFINKNKDLAEQGSQKWLNERKYIIGGSEISTLIGKNPFSNIERLIAEKVDLCSFTGNTACRWGNLFEMVTQLIFKAMFVEKPDKIYSTGSVPHKTIKNHSYSPDGLCCIGFKENNLVYKNTLLEFKSPYSSIPTTKVPTHYLPQVKAGLCTIDIAESAIFVNNMFRKCTLNQLDFTTNYDNSYHRDTEKKLKDIDIAIANGIIIFSITLDNLFIFEEKYKQLDTKSNNYNQSYMDFCDDSSGSEFDPDENAYFDDNSNILYKIKQAINNYNECQYNPKDMFDLGNATKELFDQFLDLLDDKFIDIKYIKPQINKIALNDNVANLIIPNELNYIKDNLDTICKKYNMEKILSKFTKKCKIDKSIPIAYLPWKLLRSSNIIVEKEIDYLDNIKENIDNCINIVKDINSNSKNLDDSAILLNKYFENNIIFIIRIICCFFLIYGSFWRRFFFYNCWRLFYFT